MAKKVIKSTVDFSNIFVKDAPVPKRAALLSDVIGEYVYETFNKSVKNMEESYGGEIVKGFHPSQLNKHTCKRKFVLEYLGVEFNEELKFHSAQTHRIFQNGHDVHDRIQNYLADIHNHTEGKVKLIGRWRCKSCGELYGYPIGKKKDKDCWVVRPDKCKCGKSGNIIEYKEIGLSIPELRIFGKADGVVWWKDDFWLLEIKSINPFQFQKLIEPPDYYLQQVQIYMKAVGVNQTIWLFEDKATQAFREFRTMYDEKSIKPILDILGEVNRFIDDKKMPDRLTTNVCKACEYKTECFSDKSFY